ncbi:MAG: hypothetical protein LBT06_10690 [Hungatella sp.]|jgi:hypothetical protein|nr:hypothetical protein [Hungatella sp.]
MGRAERRREERLKEASNGSGRVSLSHKEIGQIKEAAETKILEYNVEALMTCFALVMYEIDGIVIDDVQMALQRIDELMGGIVSGKETVEGYKKALQDRTGLVVSCK